MVLSDMINIKRHLPYISTGGFYIFLTKDLGEKGREIVKIGFIGAGKVASAFSLYLIEKNLSVDYVYSRSRDSALNMSKLTRCGYCETLRSLVDASNLIFITTSDNEISNVANKISGEFTEDINSYPLKDKTFVHMSGALTSQELASLKLLGASTYSLHPLQSFAERDKALNELGKTVFSLEGDLENDIIKKLIEQMGNKLINLSAEAKIKYHIAACISSNYLVTLLNSSVELFKEIGIERDLAIEALNPLMSGAYSNFLSLSSVDALTGPIKRGDYKTVENHIRELSDSKFSKLYRVMGQYTLEIAKESGAASLNFHRIKEFLED